MNPSQKIKIIHNNFNLGVNQFSWFSIVVNSFFPWTLHRMSYESYDLKKNLNWWIFWIAGSFDERKTPLRIVLLLTYCWALVLYISYSAVLVSQLTVTRVEMPFKRLDQFYVSNSYQLGIYKKNPLLGSLKARKINVVY